MTRSARRGSLLPPGGDHDHVGDQEGEDDYHFDDYTDEGRLMLQHAIRVAVLSDPGPIIVYPCH